MTRHRLTLTFDNGPSAETTAGVLDLLRDRGLAAWFCVVGERVAAPGGAELVRRTLDEGHRIVNHSMTHQVPLGDDPSADHAYREIVEAGGVLDEAVGQWGARWFRPFGRGGLLGPHVFSDPALALFREHGYSVVLWNSVPRDWEDHEGWVDTALRDIDGHDHTVVVLHDLPTGAMEHLPRFLDEVAARDVEVTLDLPPDCVPVASGEPQWDLGDLTAA